MTTILEKCIAIIAPNQCLTCGSEDNVLCDECLPTSVILLPPICVLCAQTYTGSSRACLPCRLESGIDGLWIASVYGGVVEKLVQYFKFERKSVVARPLARLLVGALPQQRAADIHIVSIPTASSHQRVRGYDHADLLARELSNATGLQQYQPLVRTHNLSQKGATSQQRQAQAQSAFAIPRPNQVKGRRILLVDDVLTTGATLVAAAKVLKAAGAAKVYAVAIAHQLPKSHKYDKIT